MNNVSNLLKLIIEYIWLVAALISVFIAGYEWHIHSFNEALPFFGLFFMALFFFLIRRKKRKNVQP